MEKQRIQKLIAQAGIASRRKAEQLIIDEKVFVNGNIAKLGDKASFSDEICVNGKAIKQKDHIYLLMNKPMLTICSLRDPQGRKTVIDIIGTDDYLFPVGRLDYLTKGVLLLTNDGDLANKLLHPRYEIKRVYKARLDKKLTTVELDVLNSEKIKIDGKISRQKVELMDNKTYYVTLRLGWNHHVKKIFEFVGKNVISLTRMEFAGLNHIGIQKGTYRPLTTKELRQLKKLTNS